MKPNFFSIPTPCSEDWNKMDATEQGAFCAKCTKEVIDCSTVKTSNIKEALTKAENPCVRIKPHQIDELNLIEWFNHLSLKKQLKYLFLFTFILVFKFDVKAQEESDTLIQPQHVELDSIDILTSKELIIQEDYQPDTTNELSLVYESPEPLGEPFICMPLSVMGGMSMGVISFNPILDQNELELITFVNPYDTIPEAQPQITRTNYLAVGKNHYSFFIEEDTLIFQTNAQIDEQIHLRILRNSDEKIVYFSPIKILQGQQTVNFPLEELNNGTYTIIIENHWESKGIELIYW